MPVNKLDKVFLSHLHADHTGDLLTLVGSYAKVGRADGPIYLWGPSGTEPRLGTRHFAAALEEALAWDTEAGRGPINPASMKIMASEFDFSRTQVVYEKNGVKITAFPVVHAIGGAVGYRLDFAGLSFVFSGDARPSWPLVRACEGGVDLLIHECFPPAAALAAESGLSIERATIALNAAHTSPKAAGQVFKLGKPRVAGLWHTLLSPQVIPLVFTELRTVYEGPVVQTQDLTVFNVSMEAVVARQAKVSDQLPPIPGVPCVPRAVPAEASRLVGRGAHPGRLSRASVHARSRGICRMTMKQVSDNCFGVLPWDTTGTFDAIYDVAKAKRIEVEY